MVYLYGVFIAKNILDVQPQSCHYCSERYVDEERLRSIFYLIFLKFLPVKINLFHVLFYIMLQLNKTIPSMLNKDLL
jgi:hypothetical protein